jgi:glutamate formiminotransferase
VSGFLLQSVPNVSEGRDTATIEAIAEAIESTGAFLADVHVDRDHNRSVFTIFAPEPQMILALIAMTAVALDRIDLTKHTGVHPRVGVVDVVPLVWLDDLDRRCANLDSAVDTALRAGDALGALYGIPVLLYGAVGGAPFAGHLRRGGIDELASRIEAGDVLVHAGPDNHQPASGMLLIGARPALVAMNVVLQSSDIELARAISGTIRDVDGGLTGVRAMGMRLESQDYVQVSCNVERWREAGPAEVLREVRDRAKEAGTEVREVEIVGLCPGEAWSELAGEGVHIASSPEPILERHITYAIGGEAAYG